MKLLVIFDSNDQDLELGIEIDRMMEDAGWTPSDEFSFAYTREADGDYDDLESSIMDDVDAATEEAGWSSVNYLYTIGNEAPKFAVAEGV